MRMETTRPWVLRYAVAVLTVGAALLATLMLPPLRERSHSSLFFAAVVVASWFGGLGPGLLAVALSAWAIDYFLVPPALVLVVGLEDVVRIAVFLLVAFLIMWLDAARKRLTTTLKQRADELVESHRHKDQFLAMLAHELRNPLAATRNAVQVMRQQGKDVPGLDRSADLAERQVRQMARLIDDLLDLSRVACGKVQLAPERVDLATVITRAVETARPLIDALNHELHVSLPPCPLPLNADPARLEQVVVNLLNNAAKFTEPGGRIWVAGGFEGEEAVIRVRDIGLGIAPDLLARVFDLFTQGAGAKGCCQGGLGIGLFLVRRLVEMHGGGVQANSAGPGQGSEFVVRLPACPTVGPDNFIAASDGRTRERSRVDIRRRQ